MHADEVATDVAVVRRLLAEQFPRWADLPIVALETAGTDNALYRLGDAMSVRLPRTSSAATKVALEQNWLPRLAPHLPLPVAKPLGRGAPGEGYPFPWSVLEWLPGEDASAAPVADLTGAARELAAFVAALHRIDPEGAPRGRGRRLEPRDAFTREALAKLAGWIDVETASAVWDECLRADVYRGPGVWTHADLIPTNLLVEHGRLSAVIDFGCAGLADPAWDLTAAWSFLSGEARGVFRAALEVDDATWQRGRGFALSQALLILPYYRQTNPVLVAVAERMVAEVLADS